MTTPVAIALIAHNDCYLIGRRGPDGPLPGYFEFPGGKCLWGESPEACVVRECFEETGLVIEPVRLRREIFHTYPYGTVDLHFFDCRLVPGCEATRVRPGLTWVPRGELAKFDFPEPNRALVAELIQESASS